MSLIRNEQIKLTATFLNGIGVAVFAVGGLAPVFSGFSQQGAPSLAVAIAAIICFVTALALHWIARLILGRLEP